MPGGFIAASRDSIKEYLNEIPQYRRHRQSRHSTCTVLYSVYRKVSSPPETDEQA